MHQFLEILDESFNDKESFSNENQSQAKLIVTEKSDNKNIKNFNKIKNLENIENKELFSVSN